MDGMCELLAELELYLHGNRNYPVHCLCSRAFIRNKIEIDNGVDLKEAEKLEQFDFELLQTVYDLDKMSLTVPKVKKQEVEVVSCYCSASHYSTDDYESVMQSTSDHCHNFNVKQQPVHYPLHNSDSGADLSENFTDKSNFKVNKNSQNHVDSNCASVKSNLELAWEKYWSINGESIIWKSWIEKYGAYINPSYLEQNNLSEIFEMEIDDSSKEQTGHDDDGKNINNAAGISDINFIKTHNDLPTRTDEYFSNENSEKVPDLKISTYLSCNNLSDMIGTVNTNTIGCDLEFEDNILKSTSCMNYETEEKDKYLNSEEDQVRHYEHERVRSRCSNTNLSVKSVANTTVTTDSMTNVTKITLSSLDLSCECESVQSSSLSTSSIEDSAETESSSSSSSKEEMCTEADAWWKKLWKEHYEDQYSLTYKCFSENFKQMNQIIYKECEMKVVSDLNVSKSNQFPQESKKTSEEIKQDSIFESRLYLNSISHVLQRLEKTDLKHDRDSSQVCEAEIESGPNESSVEKVSIQDKSKSSNASKTVSRENIKRQLILSEGDLEESEYDLDEVEDRLPKRISRKNSSHRLFEEKQSKSSKKLDSIKQAMSLIGFSYRLNSDYLKSGRVTYRKKNIKNQNRRLKLSDQKLPTHIFFDDDGNEYYESKRNESLDTPESPDEEMSNKTEAEAEGMNRLQESFIEKESLGYEAHSSSVDEEIKVIDENKKQKKKKKRQKKCNNIPSEVIENKNLIKYWIKRYQLFSKFDRGIKLDMESWYSVTPEKVAMHHAQRCRCDLIIDAFCGAGGNSIQFAFTCERVIAIDIDPKKIEIAKNNARVYGVEDRIEFIVGDFTKLAIKLQGDVVFLSPPWGGPEYSCVDVYNLDRILPPIGGEELFCLANNITNEVAYFLPKNINSVELAVLPGPGSEVELEQNFLGRKLTSVTAYFGELIRDPEDPYFEIF